MSGTVAVVCSSKIYLYEFLNRSNETHKFTFIDFFEFPFHIKLEFKPEHLVLAEHVIACSSSSIAVAFKIVDLSDINTEDGSTSNSMTTDSSVHITGHQKLTQPIDFEVAKQYNQVNGMEFKKEICSNWDSDTTDRRANFSEERPILVNDIKIVIKSTNRIDMADRVFYSIRSLVQLRIPQNKTANSVYDEFRCIRLKPIYYKRDGQTTAIEKEICGHLMKSNFHGNCVGFSLFVSTVSDGYLYQFTNQGKAKFKKSNSRKSNSRSAIKKKK